MNDTDPAKQASASGHSPAGWIDALLQDRVMGELSLWPAHLGLVSGLVAQRHINGLQAADLRHG